MREGGFENRSTEKDRALKDYNLQRDFNTYREKFASFYDAIASDHAESETHRGHGLDHDVTVAQLAAHIAPDDRTAEKAWCAAMLHSTDRYTRAPKVTEGAHDVGEKILENLRFLPIDYFSANEIEELHAAASRHDELNTGAQQPEQSMTQMVLMDADRLVNLMPAVAIRAGQFQPEIPSMEFKYLNGMPNPDSTYHSPKSVLDDLRLMIKEYIPQLRLPPAKQLGEIYARRLEKYIQEIEKDHEELGLKGIQL